MKICPKCGRPLQISIAYHEGNEIINEYCPKCRIRIGGNNAISS